MERVLSGLLDAGVRYFDIENTLNFNDDVLMISMILAIIRMIVMMLEMIVMKVLMMMITDDCHDYDEDEDTLTYAYDQVCVTCVYKTRI